MSGKCDKSELIIWLTNNNIKNKEYHKSEYNEYVIERIEFEKSINTQKNLRIRYGKTYT